MGLKSRINYLRRIFAAYLRKNKYSQLTFWHGKLEINKDVLVDKLSEYYMSFLYKANYPGPFDKNGIPLLDYRGIIGKQYNPIAVAQYGLGHYNLYKRNRNRKNLEIAIKQADWLVNNLEKNTKGVSVWMHYFDWEYRDKLKAPWYSALAQGNGISLLVRIHLETEKRKYLETAQKAFKSFLIETKDGGVKFIDNKNNIWLEEYIVNPPTHVLNGFVWTLWGIYDYWLLTKEAWARKLFNECVKTLEINLQKYDTGFWSLYEQSGTKMKMLASPFYHSLHIVQLKVLYKMTNEPIFKKYSEKWEKYQHNWFYRNFALIYKIIFKIFYY